jgi:penicillin amidase
MIHQDPNDSEPRLITRGEPAEPTLHPHDPVLIARNLPARPATERSSPHRRFNWQRLIRAAAVFAALLAVAGTAGVFYARHWVRWATAANLPQLDGTLRVQGLNAPVTVQRDAHGVPHLRAASLDDLIFAQAFITAEDRLFQMDTLRRLAAGELAEILGPKLLPSDELQRFLQLRAAADRAVAQLPPAQLHLLQVYAAGVNASIAEQQDRLPVEFRVLHYTPAPWTPRDSVLIQLIMFEDLTNRFESKLAREALTAQLTQAGSANLIADLYPTSSWRDHTPADPQPDLTIPGPSIDEVPLDESQSRLASPDPLPLNPDPCSSCFPGSNNWVVSGARTASGKPLLSNDMHLNHSLPGIWYEADLEAPIPGSEPLHVAGVTLPGVPLVVVGHNDHIAWGFTNLGADVQDLYLETTRGTGGSEQFQAVDGSWQTVLRIDEPIKVRFGRDIHLTVLATRHGDAITPILTPLLKGETRQIALRWTAYDPDNVKLPVVDIATAHDWPSFLAAFAQFGGPAQNVVYADDQGHIGYHAAGRIPLRGPAQAPAPNPVAQAIAPENPEAAADIQAAANPPAQLSGPLSAVPLVPSAAHEWSGYIPFDQLPQVFDPPSGVIATANARVAPDDYPYPITLDWGSSYRTERILHLLLHRNGLTPADMLAIQTDVYSDFDRVLAQRLAYALDRSTALAAGKTYKPEAAKNLRVAADLLRTWNGRVTVDSAAAEIVANVHAMLWPMLLQAHLKPKSNAALLYQRYGRDSALEEILTHTPQRWLPPSYANWDDFLTDAVAQGLGRTHPPRDLAKLRYGADHTVDIESPIFAQSEALRDLLGRPTGTGEQPQSGDGTTVKQVGHTFGPSERFTANLANLDQSTLNIVTGQSGNPDSPWFLDQFAAWYRGTTYPFPYSTTAVNASTTHTLRLEPK